MENQFERKVVKTASGYVLVAPDQVDCEEAKNVHVLPALIEVYNDKTREWVITQRKTCCNRDMRGGKLLCIPGELFLKNESRDLRNELARLQNAKTRICGTCVSHFYADYLDEK